MSGQRYKQLPLIAARRPLISPGSFVLPGNSLFSDPASVTLRAHLKREILDDAIASNACGPLKAEPAA